MTDQARLRIRPGAGHGSGFDARGPRAPGVAHLIELVDQSIFLFHLRESMAAEIQFEVEGPINVPTFTGQMHLRMDRPISLRWVD